MMTNVPKISDKEIEKSVINREIKEFLKKSFVDECDRLIGDFISTILTREKKDVSFWNIVNLKYLYHYVKCKCF